MKLEEFINDISSDGLKDILANFGEPYSFTKPELVERVLKASNGLSVRRVLDNTYKDELKCICKAHKLPITGSVDELLNRIVSHKEKVVTLEGLIYDIKRWKPDKKYQSEQRYTTDLHNYLEEKGYEVTTKGGATKPDLLVNRNFPIEMKYDFATKPEQNKATGQLVEYINRFGFAILVVCWYYSDSEQFDEDMNRILLPEMKNKCVAILKQPYDGWCAHQANWDKKNDV